LSINSFFARLSRNGKAAEARRKKVEAFNKKHFGSSKKPQSESAAPQPVEETRSPTPVVVKSASQTEERTLQEKMNSFADNIVNPENHPEQPVTKQSSDEPTQEDDEESQEDFDNDDKVDVAESTDAPDATSPTSATSANLIDQVKSDESTKIETISPPNSIKPMEKEEMEKFIEEQRAQQNTGLLCGCI
jgi:hypothetical protein